MSTQSDLLSSHFKVDECVLRVLAFFEASSHLNQLVPLRLLNTASPKQLADQQAVGDMCLPARAIARLTSPFPHGTVFVRPDTEDFRSTDAVKLLTPCTQPMATLEIRQYV